jgi:hypothetical protein
MIPARTQRLVLTQIQDEKEGNSQGAAADAKEAGKNNGIDINLADDGDGKNMCSKTKKNHSSAHTSAS